MRKIITALFVFGLWAAPFVRPQESNLRVTPSGSKQLTFDVSVDARTFRNVNGVNPYYPMTSNFSTPGRVDMVGTDPEKGGTFIVNGKIYPGGTIPSGHGVSSSETPASTGGGTIPSGQDAFGPDTPGSIGTWVCRGVVVVSSADIAAGAQILVCTTQFFLFDDGNRLVSEGMEGTIPTMRAVTGGTGDLSGAAGDVLQEPLGMNPTMESNLHFTFALKRSSLK